MRSQYKRIGDYIRLVDERNTDLRVTTLLGLTIEKVFMPSVANIIGTDLAKYKIIRQHQFACSLMQVRRDQKIPVALLKDIAEAIISPAYPVFEVIDREQLLPEYLMMWMSRTEFDREACFYAVGGVRGSLEWEDFCNMTLPVPDITTQRAIIAEYQTIVNRITLNEQLTKKLEETAQAIYKHWFVNFEFPDEHGNPYKSSGGEMVESELGEIPKGWKVQTVEDVCELIVDCPHSTPKWTESGVIVIRTTNFKNNMLDLTETRFTDERHYEKRTARAVPTAGDIIITREAPMGLVATVPKGVRLCMGQRMVLLRANPKKLSSVVLYHLLLSRAVQIQIALNEGTGSTVSNLRIPALKGICFATPDVQSQYGIVSRLQALEDHRHLNHAEGKALAQLRDILLSKLISGKPRISDAEKLAEEVLP